MKNYKKILIVEDEFISAEYLKELLEKDGYEVVDIVDNGPEAIEKCNKLKPDIVLMDIMLNGQMSGCEAAVEIYQRHKHSCEILFLSAYTSSEMVNYATDAHAYGYLMKPYREGEILATLKLIATHEDTQPEIKTEKETIELNHGYLFNTKLHRLFTKNREVPLGKRPLKLIELLAKNKNSSVSHEQICHYIWGENKSNATLRSLIHRIRTTVYNDFIININGLGYKIN
jgi:DNA-binding response OmpR family regulator